MSVAGIGYAAGGGADAIENLIQQRMRQAAIAEEVRSNQANEALRQQQINEMAAERRARDQELADTREEAAVGRRVNTLPAGTFIPTDQAAPFQKHGYGGLLKPVPASPGVEPDFQGPLPEGQTREARPAGFELRPTRSAQEFEEKIAQREREAAMKNAYDQGLLKIREDNLARLEAAQNNRLNPPDDPTLPNGVKEYIGQLRASHGNDYLGAQRELNQTMNQLRQQHRHLDPQKAQNALRQQFAQPTGAGNPLLQMFGGGVNVDPSQFTTAQQDKEGGPRPAPTLGTQTINGAELAATAKRLGITPEQAAAEARKRGLVIVP